MNSVAELPEGLRPQAVKKLMAGAKRAPAPEPAAQSAPEWMAQQLPKAKYGNIKTEVDGIKFDSQKEARRYEQLKAAVAAGAITQLRLQADFTLQDAYTADTGERIRAIRYRADFTYRVKAAGYDLIPAVNWQDIEYWRSLRPGELVVEDVKSKATRTKDYILKRKLMADRGYSIREV